MNAPYMSVHVTPKGPNVRYKSISEVHWNDIPGFAILTGRNGSGKTQLLEILAYSISGATPPNLGQGAGLPVNVQIEGTHYAPEEIAFVPSAGRFSGGTPASIANMPQVRQQFVQQAQNQNAYGSDIFNLLKAKRALKALKGQIPFNATQQQLSELLPDTFDFMIDDVDITAGLNYVFVAHRLKMLESLERNTPGVARDGRPLGPAPWEVLNEALAVAGFPYSIISPSHYPIMDSFELTLQDKGSGSKIRAIDLSSGEQVLFQLVLWLYASNKDGVFPKLLLLDEPDAHLHPSMTTQFLDVISEVLVAKHSIRVVMTSHSPSTVALAPDDAVFQLERGASTVIQVKNRPDIISVLTAGLVTVSRSTKFCFVEDEDDVTFYNAIRDLLTDQGPSRDPAALNASPTIAFVAASIGAGVTKISGGCTIVEKWVDKLDAEPLKSSFLGLIDSDNKNVARDRIFVLSRYSYENYMLDPLNIFVLLIEENTAPPIPGLNVKSGDEHLFRLQSTDILQAASDAITSRMEASLAAIKTSVTEKTVYTNGAQIIIPSWVTKHRGHDLLPIAQNAFGGAKIISPPRLIKALRRGRLIPSDLAKILSDVQHT